MRLSPLQIESIKAVFKKYFLKTDSLWLFGSRIDPAKKGGDIDLYIETYIDDATIVVNKQIEFLVELKKRIGEQKIDVIINCVHHHVNLKIYDEAKVTGIKLV